MVEIGVGRDHVALVDDGDVELVGQHKWTLMYIRRYELKYAKTRVWVDGKRRTILMHRLLMGLTWGEKIQVDHKNHDGLDNRRENIRLANSSQQRGNSRKGRRKYRSPYATKVRGVYQDIAAKTVMRFCARIGVNGRTVPLGSFRTLEEAAMRYNVAARQYYGEYAWLNQVEMG